MKKCLTLAMTLMLLGGGYNHSNGSSFWTTKKVLASGFFIASISGYFSYKLAETDYFKLRERKEIKLTDDYEFRNMLAGDNFFYSIGYDYSNKLLKNDMKKLESNREFDVNCLKNLNAIIDNTYVFVDMTDEFSSNKEAMLIASKLKSKKILINQMISESYKENLRLDYLKEVVSEVNDLFFKLTNILDQIVCE